MEEEEGEGVRGDRSSRSVETIAEAAEDWVTGAVSSPKKFDFEEEGVTSPASIALTLEESNSPGGEVLE